MKMLSTLILLCLGVTVRACGGYLECKEKLDKYVKTNQFLHKGCYPENTLYHLNQFQKNMVNWEIRKSIVMSDSHAHHVLFLLIADPKSKKSGILKLHKLPAGWFEDPVGDDHKCGRFSQAGGMFLRYVPCGGKKYAKEYRQIIFEHTGNKLEKNISPMELFEKQYMIECVSSKKRYSPSSSQGTKWTVVEKQDGKHLTVKDLITAVGDVEVFNIYSDNCIDFVNRGWHFLHGEYILSWVEKYVVQGARHMTNPIHSLLGEILSPMQSMFQACGKPRDSPEPRFTT